MLVGSLGVVSHHAVESPGSKIARVDGCSRCGFLPGFDGAGDGNKEEGERSCALVHGLCHLRLDAGKRDTPG